MRTKVLSNCPDDNLVRWARSLVEMPDWLIATSYGYSLDQAQRVQVLMDDLLAELVNGR